MSDFKGIMKNGWHPKGKDGGKESWRGDFKGINQVAGWMGKGKQSDSAAANEHVSRPLTTLKDPAAFGPPPRNVNYHGGAALPNEITPHRSGLGAPLSREEIQEARQVNSSSSAVQEEEQKPAPPPLPYRADRTGLKTDHLPPPPVHRDIQKSEFSSTSTSQQPRLPPRLPARQDNSPPPVEPPPPAYESVTQTTSNTPSLNQSAVNRLGRAGVSVPALGIGNNISSSNPWKNEHSQSQNQNQGGNQLSELQQRFSKMATNTSPQSPTAEHQVNMNQTSHSQPQSPQSPQSMPSWKQSQSAFGTAQNLRNNPQSVTVADAQAAAQTAGQAQRSANAFRERHADSISKAQTKAKAWDQKYKVSSKINKYFDENTDNDQAQQPPQQNTGYTSPPPQQAQIQPHLPQQPTQAQPLQQNSDMATSLSRKPPPPPPPKKPASMHAPPPVPMGTKPSFG